MVVVVVGCQADDGDETAFRCLGDLYRDGVGVPQVRRRGGHRQAGRGRGQEETRRGEERGRRRAGRMANPPLALRLLAGSLTLRPLLCACWLAGSL